MKLSKLNSRNEAFWTRLDELLHEVEVESMTSEANINSCYGLCDLGGQFQLSQWPL